MSPSSAGFCSTFTHGYISTKHCDESSYCTLTPQKGTTKAVPLVVNDWLFVHVAFHCLCPDMSAVTHVLQPCQGSESERVLTSVKDSEFKGPSWLKWTTNCTSISGLRCVFCIWHKVDPRTLLIPCWSVWVICVCDHSLFPSMWICELVSDLIVGMGVWRAECLTGNVKMRKG